MKICFISDTHAMHRRIEIPKCDLLIHTGDITMRGNLEVIRDFNLWIDDLKKASIINEAVAIGGNHDKYLQEHPSRGRKALSRAIYLQDEWVIIEGIKIYGSPWTPTHETMAFTKPRGELMAQKWATIPKDVDILLTHGPPADVLDMVGGLPQGCVDLAHFVRKIKPKIHAFGHIHEGYGMRKRDGITYVNSSACNHIYHLINPPIVIDYEPEIL